jgi:hypothetical protein
MLAQSVKPLSGPALAVVGPGTTITSTVNGVPGQPFAVGVIVNVVVCVVVVVLVSVPFIDEPDPLAGIPVRFAVLFLTHVKVVPETPFGLVILIVLMATPEQTVCVSGVALTVGVGFTVIV